MPFAQVLNDQTVPLLDHFVKEKIIPLYPHFSHNGLESPEPCVGYFSRGGIKGPLPVVNEVRESSGVTPFIAKVVGLAMFRFHMEYINWQCASIEIVIIRRIEVLL